MTQRGPFSDPPIAQAPATTIRMLRERVAVLTCERDEARAALSLAYPRALQAAAWVVQDELDDHGYEMLIVERILALTEDEIDNHITKEHEHG